MAPKRSGEIERREFLKRAGLATAGTLLTGGAAAGTRGSTATRVSVLVDPADPTAMAPPARWAVERLRQALAARNVPSRLCERMGESDASDLWIVAAGGVVASRMAGGAAAVGPRELRLPDAPEALAIAHGTLAERPALFACGADVRGLVYAITELTDVVVLSESPMSALAAVSPAAERPFNPIRSCMRLFCSDVEDKAWFRDREFWTAYLSMLVAQRFNRVNLSFGLGYDFTTEIRDAYLHFTYPFLFDVPGYRVRATNLSDAERDSNLAMLRFISDEAAARGLHFQLGLWTHAYEWTRSPEANHRIEGLTPATHGPYCRDALAQLLKACPNIAGVTFRIHGESGVAEGSYEFWKTVFDGVSRAGRPVEIDMHAKGMDRRMIDTALAAGLPLVISPKFAAEHMGLPYHQAWIRPTELPQRDRGEGLFANSSGARSFLRYGYGDLLTEDRRYRILHRIWPGTQRLLMWGDPAFAAAYSRASSFCGSAGCELMEPLSFKGRKGSGLSGPRTAEADRALAAPRDFEKYLYTYRLWGRLLYDPEARPDAWQRLLDTQYGPAAPAVERALAAASRVLPLVTTAHMPSAANNNYWPEMYVNMSIVDASHPEPYGDTPAPKRFGTVSPLDPQLFSGVDEFADELLTRQPSGRYTPADVASALEDLARDAAEQLAQAHAKARNRADPAFRRVALDTAVQIDLGRFFALKLRAAVLYALFERTGDPQALARAVEIYGSARQAWARLVDQTGGAYADDVTFGIGWFQRGHWRDRLPAIDRDIAAMQQKLTAPATPTTTATATTGAPSTAAASSEARRGLMDAAIGRPARPHTHVRHTPPASFHRGQALSIELAAPDPPAGIRLRYRHINQAEPWRTAPMERQRDQHRATIPADYTDSAFPLQYYFELFNTQSSTVWLYPGFDATWSNQPYFLVRQAV